MEIQPRDKQEEEEEEEEEEKQRGSRRDIQQTKQQVNNPSSPTSASSSPSHEFSFTISVHPSISKITDKNTNPNSSFAIDLSPADEIFFHGHLLPLHLLSNLPVSPRSSANSLDSFTLPTNELLREENNTKPTSNNEFMNSLEFEYPTSQETNSMPGKPRWKSKSFSFLKLSKWKKGCESRQVLDQETGEKRKSKFDVLKRYARMVKPFLLFRNGRAGNHQLMVRQSYSFSGNLRVKNNMELRGRRGEFSAPASFTTSPTNSGPLVARGTLTPTCSKVDSTMEELQAAIQAAIAHCKKSIAIEDKIKNPS